MITIQDYETFLYNKSPNTRRAYVSRVEKFLKWCKKEKLEINQINAIKFLEKYNTSSTKNQTIAAIRLFFKQSEEKVHLLQSVPAVSKARTHLDSDQQDKLLKARIDPYYDVRNQLLIRLMMKGGMRISEALGLQFGDVNMTDRSIKIRGDHVKRRKDRITYIDEDTVKLMEFYLKREKIAEKEKPLFKIKAPAFRRAFKLYLRTAGLNEEMSPHSLRHTFAINYMQSGGKLDKLKKFLGHNDINTTSIYLNYTDEELKEEYDKIHR